MESGSAYYGVAFSSPLTSGGERIKWVVGANTAFPDGTDSWTEPATNSPPIQALSPASLYSGSQRWPVDRSIAEHFGGIDGVHGITAPSTR